MSEITSMLTTQVELREAAAELAAFAAGVRADRLPEVVLQRARLVVLDTVGSAIAGGPDPLIAALVARSSAASPGASLLGSFKLVDPTEAAQVNAAAATAAQIDEGHRATQGHPALHVVPAALAVAERFRASGVQLLEGVVAGYEVAVRVGEALGMLPPEVHPHGHWPVVGATAGVARVLGASEAELTQAINAAAAFVPVSPARTAPEGMGVHYLYAGLGARTAVTVGSATLAGMTASGRMLDDFLGAELASTASGRWAITENYFKLAPFCAHTLSAWEAAATVRDQLLGRGCEPTTDAAAVSVRTYSRAALLNERSPATPLAAKFSVPYVVALGLAGRPPETVLASGGHWYDAELDALMGRVSVIADRGCDDLYPRARPAEITVELRGGERASARCELPLGDSARPVADSAVLDKFQRLCAPVLGEGPSERLVAVLSRIDRVKDVSEVFGEMRDQ